MSHVIFEGTTLHFRYRIPQQFQSVLSQRVLKMSLKTGNKRLANQRAERLITAARTFFTQLHDTDMTNISPADLKSKLRAFLEHCLYEDDGNRASPPLPLHPSCPGGPIPKQYEPGELDMFLSEVRAGLVQADYTFFGTYIDKFIAHSGITVEEDSPEHHRISRGVYEMLIDLFEVKICRAKADVAGERRYMAELPQPVPASSQSPVRQVSAPPQPTDQPSPTLESVVEKYISVKMAGDWGKASIKGTPPQLRRFVECVGGDILVGDLNRDHMREYQHKMEHLPNSQHKKKYAGKSDEELMKMTIPTGHQLAPKSLTTRFNVIRSLLNWCEEEGLIVNATPLKSALKVSNQKAKTKVAKRRAFTIDELKALFENDDYRNGKFGCAAKFWAPLIALFSGARLEEICQLHLDDIRNIDGFMCFDINEEEDKAIKTSAGKRVVPVHPFLTQIGLLDRVDHLRAKGEKHLFHRSTLSQGDGKLSTNISKAFTYFRRKWNVGGETDEASEVVFHSFRHNVITWGKHNRIDRRLVKEVVGHEEGEFSDVTGGYEGQEPVKVRYDEFIKRIDFHEILDLDHLKGSMWVTKR